MKKNHPTKWKHSIKNVEKIFQVWEICYIVWYLSLDLIIPKKYTDWNIFAFHNSRGERLTQFLWTLTVETDKQFGHIFDRDHTTIVQSRGRCRSFATSTTVHAAATWRRQWLLPDERAHGRPPERKC